MKLDWNKLGARERDAVVGRTLEFKPSIFTSVSADGGKSMCAWVDANHGPWYSRYDLVAWLAAEHSRGLHLKDAIVDTEEWPRFTTEIQSAWLVVERMRAKGWQAVIAEMDGNKWRGRFSGNGEYNEAISMTAPEAICLAALRAEGVGV